MERKGLSLEDLLELGIDIQEIESSYTETNREALPMIALPAVVCCATLMYDGVFRDTTESYSFLNILWFQDDYAFPIDAEVLEKIKQIPFGELCIETSY